MKYDAEEFRATARLWGIEGKPEEQLINEERVALRLRVAVDEAERLREGIAFIVHGASQRRRGENDWNMSNVERFAASLIADKEQPWN